MVRTHVQPLETHPQSVVVVPKIADFALKVADLFFVLYDCRLELLLQLLRSLREILEFSLTVELPKKEPPAE